MDAERIAALWAELMRGLGYARFGAQGGDWGAMVSTYLGANHADARRRHPSQHGGRVPARSRRTRSTA